MVENHRGDHIHSLYVLQLFIVFWVDLQNFLEQLPICEGPIPFIERLSSFHIFLNLRQHVYTHWSLLQWVVKRTVRWRSTPFLPFGSPRTRGCARAQRIWWNNLRYIKVLWNDHWRQYVRDIKAIARVFHNVYRYNVHGYVTLEFEGEFRYSTLHLRSPMFVLLLLPFLFACKEFID